MNRKNFEKNLMLFGHNIAGWPEDIRQDAKMVCKSSYEYQMLLKEEKEIDQLLKTRKFEAPSANLAQRIIISANNLVKQPSNVTDFSEFIYELLIRFLALKPVLALILILIFGFFLGYSNPFVKNINTEVELVSFTYDYGSLP